MSLIEISMCGICFSLRHECGHLSRKTIAMPIPHEATPGACRGKLQCKDAVLTEMNYRYKDNWVLRHSQDRLMFIMGTIILERWSLYFLESQCLIQCMAI